jgi:hypothetical protein
MVGDVLKSHGDRHRLRAETDGSQNRTQLFGCYMRDRIYNTRSDHIPSEIVRSAYRNKIGIAFTLILVEPEGCPILSSLVSISPNAPTKTYLLEETMGCKFIV